MRTTPASCDGPDYFQMQNDSEDSRSHGFGAACVAWFVLVSGLSWIIWSWSSGGIVFELTRSDFTSEMQLARLKDFFERQGSLAPFVYFVFVTIEVVVAPIPGLMLYAPGGILFGPWLGGSLAVAGNTCGAGFACILTRSLNGPWLQKFFKSESLHRTETLLRSHGFLVVFLLRLNPLTSSDVVSFAAGFTRIPVWKVMLATGCGMVPLCFAQAWAAQSLLQAFPDLLYPLLAACLVYAVCVILVIWKLVRNQPPTD